MRTKENLIKMLLHPDAKGADKETEKGSFESSFEEKLRNNENKLAERIWRSHRDMKFDAWRTVYDLRKELTKLNKGEDVAKMQQLGAKSFTFTLLIFKHPLWMSYMKFYCLLQTSPST